jgi:hypothetical protein
MGQWASAVELARRVLALSPGNQDALLVLAAASCYLRDAKTARWAYEQLGARKRHRVQLVCKRNGISVLAHAKSPSAKRKGATSKTTDQCTSDKDCYLRQCCCKWMALRKGAKPPRRCALRCRCAVPPKPKGVTCAAGKCEIVEGTRSCYEECLRQSAMQAVGWEAIKAQCRRHCRAKAAPPRPPNLAPSKDRACNKDKDCVFRPRSFCSCTPCGPTWRQAINRRARKALIDLWARRRCRKPKCPRCAVQWLGKKAVCVEGQCTVEGR